MDATIQHCGKCRWELDKCDCPNGPSRIYDYPLPPEKIGFIGGYFDGRQLNVGVTPLYKCIDGPHVDYYELVTNCMAVCTPNAKERWEGDLGGR